MTSRQGWLPDFGLYLAGKGSGNNKVVVPGFPMADLFIRARGEYTIGGVATGEDGQRYMATLDFGQPVLDGLLETLPAHAAGTFASMIAEAGEASGYYAQLRLETPLVVTIEAQLGSVAHGEDEDFIPLVADRIIHLG